MNLLLLEESTTCTVKFHDEFHRTKILIDFDHGMCGVIRSNLRNYVLTKAKKKKGGKGKYREAIITSARRGFADEV